MYLVIWCLHNKLEEPAYLVLLALGAIVLFLLAELLLARHRLQTFSQRDGLRRRPQRLRHRRVLRELLLLRRQIPEIGEMFASCYSQIISIENDAYIGEKL